MDARIDNETFKLLQLSEDSKELSEDLFSEIIPQRKRKVRRKTRPRQTTNAKTQDINNAIQCNRLIVWIAIFLTCCWLLTLSYMIAVIHAENLRLEVQIKEPSQVSVPLRSGGKKMRKRRELDALVAHSLAKRANKKNNVGNGVNSQDQLLSPSTDEQDDIGWPKIVRSSSRARNRKYSFFRMCGPLIFVSCISLSLGFMYWLYFDLRQQLYEYRQKIEEVSVTSQNLPEALQKWHETSKNLEQNQTIIYGKIAELQHSLENLSSDFSQYKNKLNEKKDYSKDEKFVANFGAKIEAVTVDVEGMKERFSEFQKDQINFKNDLQNLTKNFSAAVLIAKASNNNSTTNCSEEIAAAKDKISDQIKLLASNLSIINDTLSQKSKALDEELVVHKNNLESLTETVANTTSHVVSIEDDWTKYKTKAMDFESFSNNFNSEILNLRNSSTFLESAVREVRSECNNYRKEFLQNLEELKERTIKKETKIIKTVGGGGGGGEGGVATDHKEENNSQMPKEAAAAATKSVAETEKVRTTTSAVNPNSTTTEISVEGKPKLLSIQTLKAL